MGNAQAVKATLFLSIVKTYVMSAALYADHKYRQDPAAFNCALLIIVAVVAIADACLMGLMSVSTVGGLIVGGLTNASVQIACETYNWNYFLPELSVILPVYAGLGFAGIFGEVTFLSANNVSV
ncbi:hypothetical protein BG006_000953 [Podila minutissima]|uniref:Uncharacterized protein n=1 Tax=Podila minutissima TaxID=64525 RepID=A0A9P5SDB5_9FUNG|nr:hypothetical protein BG006_000953 [Podila minutissima]